MYWQRVKVSECLRQGGRGLGNGLPGAAAAGARGGPAKREFV